MSPSPFESLSALRGAFSDGLHRLLQEGGLGAFVLVLANAAFDPQIMARLGAPLGARFQRHLDKSRNALAQGHELPDAPDDVLVFLKIALLGMEGLGATRFRRAGPWEVQYNPLRTFRPKRLAGSTAAGIEVPFNADGFQFNKPFLRRETLWRGRLLGRTVDLLYNKFPFVDLHGLLVPEREQCHPQFLDRVHHDYLWQTCQQLGEALPGIGFGYNSYGAYASVNHLHFQMFVRRDPLPLQDARWAHNGGADTYPAVVHTFAEAAESWRWIQHLHHLGQPYNLICVPGRLYCLPRLHQMHDTHPRWTSGFAWYEMAGGAIAAHHEDFNDLSADRVAAELARVGARARAD